MTEKIKEWVQEFPVEETPNVTIVIIKDCDKPCICVPEGIRGKQLSKILKKKKAQIKIYKNLVKKDSKPCFKITINI